MNRSETKTSGIAITIILSVWISYVAFAFLNKHVLRDQTQKANPQTLTEVQKKDGSLPSHLNDSINNLDTAIIAPQRTMNVTEANITR